MGFSVDPGYRSSSYDPLEETKEKTKPAFPVIIQDNDSIEQTSGSYQEEYVPSVYSPQLGRYDPNASKLNPSSDLTDPNAFFESTLDSGIQNTPLSQEARNAGFTSQSSLARALTFAYNHPEIDSGAFLKNLLQQLTESSKALTQSQFGLSASWTPDNPDTADFDKQVGEFNASTFSRLVDGDPDLSESDKNLFMSAHNGRNSSTLTPSQLARLTVMEGLADQATAELFGLPDNFEIPQDEGAFNTRLSDSYDGAFQNLLAGADLSDSEKAQLTTLHNDPDAQVPDRNSLLGKLANLNQQAANAVKNNFGLPQNTTFTPNSKLFHAGVMASFTSSFAQNVKNSNMNPEMKALLLGTNGLDGKNLPTAAKAQFDLIKSSTLNTIIQEFGLPKSWQPKTEKKSTTDEAKESEGTDETEGEEEGVTGDAQIKQGVGDIAQAKSKKGTGDIGEVAGRSGGTGDVGDVGDVKTDYDPKLAGNAIDLIDEMGKGYSEVMNEISPNDSWNANDYLKIVGKGLSTMRATLYEQQTQGAELSRKTAVSMLDNSNAKASAQMEKLDEERNKKDIIELLVEWCPIINLLPDNLKKDLVEAIKFALWAVDLVLGGVLSTIADAAGIKPLYPDWATKGAGAKATMALQIIVMVVIMAVSIVSAQPELAGALVAKIAEDITQLVATTGVQVAKIAAEQAAKEAVEQAVKAGVEAGAKEAIRAAVKESVKESLEQATKDVIEKTLKEGIEGASKKAVEKACQKVEAGVMKQIDKIADEIVEQAIREATKDLAKEGGEEAATKALKETSGNIAKRAVKEIKRFFDDLVNRLKNVFAKESKTTFERAVRDSIRTSTFGSAHAKLAAVLAVQSLIDAIASVVQGVAEVAGAVRKAQAAKEQAQLDALIKSLEAAMEVQQTGNQFLLDGMSQMSDSLVGINDLSKKITDSQVLNFNAMIGRG